MTRPYALCKLLEHGRLSCRELIEITGWSKGIVQRAAERCVKRGQIRRRNQPGSHRSFYELQS